MTSLLPDVNVWIALSDAAHSHNANSWRWLNRLSGDAQIIFTRFTQLGLLRLLTNQSVMGAETKTLQQAWKIYDFWVDDPRIHLWRANTDTPPFRPHEMRVPYIFLSLRRTVRVCRRH